MIARPGARGLARVSALTATLLAAAATAQPGERRIDRLRDAYAELDAYRADCTYEIVQRNGGWTNRRRATIDIAYDPDGRRLLIDDPEALLVVDNNTLRARLHAEPSRYVEHDLPDGWRWDDLTAAAPFLTERPLPDVALLVDPAPIDALSEGFNERATPLNPEPDDPQQRPRLQFHTQEGVFTLALDPQTRRLAAASHDLAGMPADQAVAFTYRWSPRPAASPMPDELFAFDTTGATAVASFAQLPGAGGAGPPAPPPPAIAPGEALEAELTTIDGEPIQLADADVSTLVLCFVTTWAVGGADTVTAVADAADRAQAADADAAFFIVDLYEDAATVRQTFEPLDLDVPIVLDPEGVLAEAVQAFLVPTTVVVRDGNVIHALPANTPDLADRLFSIAAERTRDADESSAPDLDLPELVP